MHVKVHRFSTVDYAGDFAGAKVLVLQRFCRGSEAVRDGAGAEVQILWRCRGGAEMLRSRGADIEVQRCSEMQILRC